jgi:hypothetical protein
MTKNNNFDDENLIDQPEMGCYYHSNMFRFPEDDLMRPQPPQMKMPYMKQPSMMQQTPSMTPMQMPSATNEEAPLSPTLTDIGYTQAYLRTLIGKKVRVSFLIGTNLLVDRVGTLTKVGISYIVLLQFDAQTNVMCDLYSIKFVDIYAS